LDGLQFIITCVSQKLNSILSSVTDIKSAEVAM
jgi:hypothetical protein